MKHYYYNNQKVRSSENEYTHGIIYNNKVVACCSRYDLALKRLHQEAIYRREQIASQRRYIAEHPQCDEHAKSFLNELIRRFDTLHIVELEQR